MTTTPTLVPAPAAPSAPGVASASAPAGPPPTAPDPTQGPVGGPAGDAPRVVVLVGNPRPASRTAGAGRALGRRVRAGLADGTGAADAGATPGAGHAGDVGVVDLATIGAELLAPEHPRADVALAAVAAADVLVVATPVHKASIPGLLKAFLDLYGPDGLAGVVAVPLVVPGDGTHALVGEVHLRPVLVELGAVVPAASLVVPAGALADLDAHVETWWRRWGGAVRRAVPAAPAAAPVDAVPSAAPSTTAVAR
ncbi:NADPH-dependent FMN reductase [Cellulomonas endophytica]|uniref:NADPH-dependent FMN reductase n=1 Tax=Cellulomonas endophytica TaxID=2494735 RepID=UPI0023EA64C9|nr:NAD(P)H-dependent oxidoreductase [Cellulomonas endophytica]